jgi:flagellar hook-basal body complex protein FliE
MQIHSESLLAQHADKTMRLLQKANAQSNQATTESGNANPFSNLLTNGIGQVNNMQLSANSQMEQLLTGGDVNQAEVFTSMQKADMSFRLLVQIRNKLMDAYGEINSIRV